jgi:hypothetical protein
MLRPHIGLQLWKISMLRWKLIVLGKLLRKNIKISAKENLGYYEFVATLHSWKPFNLFST